MLVALEGRRSSIALQQPGRLSIAFVSFQHMHINLTEDSYQLIEVPAANAHRVFALVLLRIVSSCNVTILLEQLQLTSKQRVKSFAALSHPYA